MLRIFFPIILLMFPLSVFAEWECPAIAGCKIVLDTGECIGCIEVDEQPIIKEEKLVVEKKPKVSQSKDRKPRKRERNWVGILFECIVGCKEGVIYWDEGGNEFDKNLNLISTN